MAKDLFSFNSDQVLKNTAPLAERLRPRTLDEFVGQTSILAEGRLLRRAIASDRIGNLLLHGPPGVGKTTLAKIIAAQTRSHFSVLNAVLAGVKDLRKEVDDAKERLELYGLRSILFVDEVHRFNTAQQDALLPWVENGTITLIGATTQNPFFEVNKALLSRTRLFRLQPLEASDLHQLLKRALEDEERGYGKIKVLVNEEAANHLVDISNGDARSLLNALELAVESTKPDKEGYIRINLLIAEESIQERAVLYDKNGDSHFNTISAFIKSLRGSDPDASLFWLARMLEAGENPRFIFRRMLISAGEDIGLADPQAIVVVQACADAFERIGLPEGIYALTQAALYLATTAKSNSLSSFFSAQKAVKEFQKQDVPLHLRDAHHDGESFGDGANYLYPHSYLNHWVPQQYMPNELHGKFFWDPTPEGWEGRQRQKVLEKRVTQMAIINEVNSANTLLLTNGPQNSTLNNWLQNQSSQEVDRLNDLASQLWSDLDIKRHHRILVLTGDSLLWALNPLKLVPEGGVVIASPLKNHERLNSQLELLDSLDQPILIDKTAQGIDNLSKDFKFEWIGGRIYFEDLSMAKIDNIWSAITRRLTSESALSLLTTTPNLAPAKALKQMLESSGKVEIDISFLNEIISLEQTWIKSKFNSEYLNQKLIDCDWILEIKKWEEKLALKIDKNLEHRWLAKNTMYRSLLDGKIKSESIERFQSLLLSLEGERLPQELSHQIIYGRRTKK